MRADKNIVSDYNVLLDAAFGYESTLFVVIGIGDQARMRPDRNVVADLDAAVTHVHKTTGAEMGIVPQAKFSKGIQNVRPMIERAVVPAFEVLGIRHDDPCIDQAARSKGIPSETAGQLRFVVAYYGEPPFPNVNGQL
jgi:hypothetical protein